jgi:hypothetical protein
MTAFRWKIVLVCATLLAGANQLYAQKPHRADDLPGTWQLVSSRNLTTGTITQSTNTSWIQFTKSHWAVLAMEPGRKVIMPAEFEKLSEEEQVKTNYARIWDENNQQIFQARAGSYKLDGNKLRHTATIAIQTNIIGIERVLKIIRLDKTTLVAQTEFPDAPTLKTELTYKRID